jgi:hypothetical protein
MFPLPSSLRTATSPRSWQVAGFALLFLYVAAGIVYSFAIPAVNRFPDEYEYHDLSSHLIHGPGFSLDGVHLTSMRPPGYPFFLAGIEALGGGIVAVRIVQFFLIAATILMVCQFCARSQRFGLLPIVTGLVALYPVLFYIGGTSYPQTLAEFLFMAGILLITSREEGLVRKLGGGWIFGALILAVPIFLHTLGVVLAVAWLLKMIHWKGALVVLMGAGLIITPWTIRNAVRFHHFVPIASNSGVNLLIGNSETSTPYGGSGNVDLGIYERVANTPGYDEVTADRYYQQAAVNWMKHHPTRALVLYFEKVLNFFNVWNKYAKKTTAEVTPATSFSAR